MRRNKSSMKSSLQDTNVVPWRHAVRIPRYTFKDKDPEGTNSATFTLEEWMEDTMYS